MTIIITNPQSTVMYSDVVQTTDNITNLTYQKLVHIGPILMGMAGDQATRQMLVATSLNELVASWKTAIKFLNHSAALVFYEGRTWQLFPHDEEVHVVKVVGAMAVGSYRLEWLNFYKSKGSPTDEVEFEELAIEFCESVTFLWGYRNVVGHLRMVVDPTTPIMVNV